MCAEKTRERLGKTGKRGSQRGRSEERPPERRLRKHILAGVRGQRRCAREGKCLKNTLRALSIISTHSPIHCCDNSFHTRNHDGVPQRESIPNFIYNPKRAVLFYSVRDANIHTASQVTARQLRWQQGARDAHKVVQSDSAVKLT